MIKRRLWQFALRRRNVGSLTIWDPTDKVLTASFSDASRFKSVYEGAQKGVFNLQDGSASIEIPKQSGLEDGRD